MRFLKARYVASVEVKHPDGETETLHVWMNPETRSLVAVGNMQYVSSAENFVRDPYLREDVRLVFEDTFSGLPR